MDLSFCFYKTGEKKSTCTRGGEEIQMGFFVELRVRQIRLRRRGGRRGEKWSGRRERYLDTFFATVTALFVTVAILRLHDDRLRESFCAAQIYLNSFKRKKRKESGRRKHNGRIFCHGHGSFPDRGNI